MQFAGLFRKTADGSSRRQGNRLWRAVSVFAWIFRLSSFPRKRESIHPPARGPEMDSRFRGNDSNKFYMGPRAWSLTARRRYEWMRSPTRAKGGA
jgi:hypothetical protein